ncbi:MAG: hypothetical protein CML68_11830 [Rhodobacteraceae bacterium]|nr:hypothetical protein [Paracoccaceae bacterium]
MSDLNARLLQAHAAGDHAALVGLYREAAGFEPDEGARGFFLTQAYVFALDCGDGCAADLRASLVAMGRESAP